MADEESTPTFRRPTEQAKRDADPHADQAAYFAYWELQRQQRIIDKRNTRAGLSIYEQSRLRDD